MNKKNNLLTLK